MVILNARTVELPDRCYKDVVVRLSPEKLLIGEHEVAHPRPEHRIDRVGVFLWRDQAPDQQYAQYR